MDNNIKKKISLLSLLLITLTVVFEILLYYNKEYEYILLIVGSFCICILCSYKLLRLVIETFLSNYSIVSKQIDEPYKKMCLQKTVKYF